MLKLSSFFLFFFLFTSCSIKNYDINQSKIVIIKSPKIKFADLAYVRSTDKAVELELFIAGTAIEKIQINHLVCVRAGCMSKAGFNEDYLSEFYPNSLLQNIILGHAIYNGKNKIENGYAFTQIIQTENVNITYKVTPSMIYFKDKANKILFKIKDIK